MASLNRVFLMGNVGVEPVVKATSSNKVVNLSLCTTERGFTKKDGTKVEDKSEWHRLVAFGKIAETIEQYVHKGTALYVEGHIHYDNYEKDGNKVYSTDIIVDSFQFVGGKSDGGNNKKYTPSVSGSNSDNSDMPF